jgi:SAM-dependent methyltransferase
MSERPNSDAIEAWDTVLFDKFVRFRWLATAGLGLHGDTALERLGVKQGSRIVDLGCGFGDTTQAIARAVGAKGEAVGIDASPRFVESAAEAAKQSDVRNARFAVRDVQTDDLGGPYAGAFSRFGMMFFASPVAALRNVRKSLAKGAPLCIVVWRRREDNEWLYEAQTVVEKIVPPPETHDAPTCGPGPFSMSGADMVSEQLQKAGFTRVTFERFDTPICIGRSLDEALEFACALGPAGETLRLVGERASEVRPQILAALRNAFARFERPDGIWASSSTWIIRAEAA